MGYSVIMDRAEPAETTILVVDDEDLLRTMLEDFLLKRGYRVLQAGDYADALGLLESTDVDLILSDIRMPGKSGVELLETVKSRGWSAPVIMITGQPEIDTVADSLRLGAFDYIVKPFRFPSLLATIQKALHHKTLLDGKKQLEIENQVYREHLEEMIGARTAELERVNEDLRREIDRRIAAQTLMRIQRDLGIRLHDAADMTSAADCAFEALFQIDGIDGAALYTREDGAAPPRRLRTVGLPEAFGPPAIRFRPGHGEVPAIFPETPVYGPPSDLFEAAAAADGADSWGWMGVLPLHHEERTVAALIVGSRREAPMPDPTIHGIETIALQLGSVIARLHAEAALREVSRRRRMALEAASEGTWDFNFRQNVHFLGPRWYTLLGYDPYELPQSFRTFKDRMHPDDADHVIRAIKERLKGDDAFEIEFRMQTKDGDWRWILCRGKVFERDETGIPMRIVGTNSDITEKKAADAEILRANLELAQIFNATSDGMCLVDEDFRILRVNDTLLRMFHWDREAVPGAPFFSLLPEMGSRFVGHSGANGVSGTERIEHDVALRRPDGGEMHLVMTSTPLKSVSGGVEGFLFNLRDITRRTLAERESRIKEKQLIQADKMKSLGILVAGMAHEISNPNNFIMLNIPLLARSWGDALPILDARYRAQGDFPLANVPYSEMRDHIPELLSAIEEGARRIKKIISSLKEYARGGAADLTENVDLNDVLEEALLLMSNPLKKCTDRLTIQRAGSLPPVRGSFHQLEQVMINLIQNACQALTGKEQPIEITTRHDPECRRVTVGIRDGGPGIPPDHLDRIFDPFFTTKRAAGGCGLGLSICAGIVKEHGGTLSIESEPGTGTRVILEFPANIV